MGSGDARTRHRPTSAEVRQRVLDAALVVFARAGFSGASIDAISAEAGYTKGAVYSSFSSKDDLFFSLLQERVRDRLTQVGEDDDAVQGVGDRARSLGTNFFALLMKDPDWQMLFLEFWARAVREPDVLERYVTVRTGLRDQIATFIEEESRRRGAEPLIPAEHLATVVLALANGLFIEEAPAPGTVPPTLLGDVLSLLLAPSRP